MKNRKQKKVKTSKPTVGIGWYREDQWDLLLAYAADRNDLEGTYAEWLEVARKSVENLSRAKVRFEKIPIDVQELIQWCRAQGCAVNAASRSEFIARKTEERFGGQQTELIRSGLVRDILRKKNY